MARHESWVQDPAADGGTASLGGYDDYYQDYYRGNTADPLSAGALVRALRALSGSVAAGLALLAAVVIVASVLGGQRGFPGPGAVTVSVHVAGSIAAVLGQRHADRHRDFTAGLASLAVFAIAAGVLWTQWWN